MKKKNIGYLFIFTCIMSLFAGVNSVSAEPIPLPWYYNLYDYTYYNWNGDYPNFYFNIGNNTITNDTSILVTWEWFDEWSAGYGYYHSIFIDCINNGKNIFNYTVKSEYEYTDLPIEPMYNINKSVTINFTRLIIPKETEVLIRFTIKINDHYEWADNFFDRFKYETITTYLSINYSNDIQVEGEVFDIGNLPYFLAIGGGSLIFVIWRLRKKEKQTELVVL